MRNTTLDNVIACLDETQGRYELVQHPWPSRSVNEKRAIITDHPQIYACFGNITIVQGSLLAYREEAEKCMLYISDGEERIPFRKIKKSIGLPRSRDLTFWKGDLMAKLGVAYGAVSPFILYPGNVDLICFNDDLIHDARAHPTYWYDLAIDTTKSLYANVAEVYDIISLLYMDKVTMLH